MMNMSKGRWRLSQLMRQIWVPVALMGVLALVTALGAAVIGRALPEGAVTKIGADAVLTILQIIASSMLAVTTFSLSIMVSAFGSAASGATPRALALLQTDRTTQRVLACFIGAFVYAIVGIIALQTQFYGEAGRFVLFVVTLGVIALVIGMLLRWVQHLTVFGMLSDTISRVERAAAAAIAERATDPRLGCARWQAVPPGAFEVRAARTGHVQHLDTAQLQAVAARQGCRVWVLAEPGSFVHPARALLACDALPGDAGARRALEEALRAAFTIAHARSHDQDPRFGLITLAEIASRALSPAVNDPGTALDILSRLARVLGEWRPAALPQERHDRVFLAELAPEALLRDAFHAIGRDGAAMIEVALRLQQVLAALAAIAPRDFAPAAAAQARRAAEFAAAALLLEEDRARIAARAERTAQGF